MGVGKEGLCGDGKNTIKVDKSGNSPLQRGRSTEY